MNNAKKYSLEAFRQTLNELKGREGITEISFRDNWLNKLKNISNITRNGWYSPPPEGIAVLFASDKNIERINFESLRNEANWPSDKIIDWDNGLLFAYESFVDTETGLLGDFDITLYFGKDPDMINHFKLCHKATLEVIEASRTINSSKILFEKSQDIFSKYSLKNSIVSITDSSSLDLGHSTPVVDINDIKDKTLSKETIEYIRNNRKYISGHSDWNLDNEVQFTIEPQLVSINNKRLPQVCFHYLIKKTENNITIMNENDELLKEYGLIDQRVNYFE